MLSRSEYEYLVYTLPTRYPSIRMSTLVLAPPGLDTAKLTGYVLLGEALVLCVHEILDFQQGVIVTYRYEVSRATPSFIDVPIPDADTYCRAHYENKQKLYWYDSWPHPHDPDLAITHPHHKHIDPDMKHHRVPTPDLSFTEPNLPFLIREVEGLLEG